MHSFILDLYRAPGCVSGTVLQLSVFEDSVILFCTSTDHSRGDNFLNMVFITIINTLVHFQLLL